MKRFGKRTFLHTLFSCTHQNAARAIYTHHEHTHVPPSGLMRGFEMRAQWRGRRGVGDVEAAGGGSSTSI